MWHICLLSTIISAYNQCSENESKILIRHYYISLQFISLSISHLLSFIYFHGFDFDCICSMKHQCFIQFYFSILKIKIKFQYYVCRIHHLLEFEFALFLFYYPCRKGFFQQGQWPLFTVNTVNDGFFIIFLTALSPMSMTCCSDFCHRWIFTPQPFHFSHLAGGRVTAVH